MHSEVPKHKQGRLEVKNGGKSHREKWWTTGVLEELDVEERKYR
jgi:hypothetical protein